VARAEAHGSIEARLVGLDRLTALVAHLRVERKLPHAHLRLVARLERGEQLAGRRAERAGERGQGRQLRLKPRESLVKSLLRGEDALYRPLILKRHLVAMRQCPGHTELRSFSTHAVTAQTLGKGEITS